MSDLWGEQVLTRNDFLGGQLQIFQPRKGYRAGIDPVFLAASVPAQAGDSVLDLGCGAGVASLCLARRVAGLRLTGLELQESYADLARKNAAENNLDFEVVTGDLAAMPETLKQRQFDHVIANPPYYSRVSSTPAADSGRETALGEQTPLDVWIKSAAKRAAPKGTVTFIQRVDRLPEMMSSLSEHLGSVELMPLIPRRGRCAQLMLLRARKAGRAAFKLHDGWLLHDGDCHDGDRESYTGQTASILRAGGALSF